MTTIKEHCCGADLFFDKKTADKKYKSYLKKGPSRVTSKIIQQLEEHTVKGKSLVDVGGGVGALQWWFLENGGSKTTDIDASTGYLEQAEEHAYKNGWEAQTTFEMGDCVEVYPQIKEVDFITLDKVVCCYPNFKEILEATCDKSPQSISLSYPMDGFIAEGIQSIGAIVMKLRGSFFRPYVHSVKEIRAVFAVKGYMRMSYNLAFPWHVETYVRN
jgi:tRNA1(Val) A37 N6-methylase TrmN6